MRRPQRPLQGATLPSDLLLDLHAAVDAESLWRAGVNLLQSAMPAYHYLMALPTEGMKPYFLRTTLPVPDEQDYWENLNRVAPLEGLIKRFAGRKVSRMSDDVPFVMMRFTPFYRKFMKPEGWRYSAGMFFWDGDRFLGQFAQNRTAEQGDFTDEEMTVLNAIHAHLEVAIHRMMLLDRERSARSAIQDSISRSPLPTVLLDWDLAPVYYNAAAAEATMIWEFGSERARMMKPAFAIPADIKSACVALRDTTASWGQSLTGQTGSQVFPHPRGDGSEFVLRVLSGGKTGFAKPHFMLEFRSAPTSSCSTDKVTLRARLTAAEREVADRVVQGLDNDSIANALGISSSTVRTHLRNIFQKLGVSNRTQLAVLFSR